MLNENIKNLRKAKGLSQEELAIKLNVVRQTVSKWEKGLSVPDSNLLISLADELDTSVSILLGIDIQGVSRRWRKLFDRVAADLKISGFGIAILIGGQCLYQVAALINAVLGAF